MDIRIFHKLNHRLATALAAAFVLSAAPEFMSGSGLGAVTACAQNTKTQEAKRAKLQKEIKMLNSRISDNAKKSRSALNSLNLVQRKIGKQKALVAASDAEIAGIDGSIKSKTDSLKMLQSSMDTLTYFYNRLILNAYKNRDTKVWYMYVLASENVGQAMRRIGYLRNLQHEMNAQAKKIIQTREEIERQTAALQVTRNQAEILRQRRQGEVNDLRSEEAKSQKLVTQLKRNKNKYQKELAAKQKQVDALNKEISRLIRASKGTAKDSKPVDIKLDAEFAQNRGKLPWPLEGPVIEDFGEHYHPVYKNIKLPFSNGITIASSEGAGVKAVFDGMVKQVVVMPGYNKCVLVQHGGYFSFYCKLGSVSVKAGDKIKTGQTIGKVDSIDGESSLHFQIWQSTSPQDPEVWLR